MSEGNGAIAPAEVAVGDEDGKVFWRFKEPITWFCMDPANAVQIAEATARAAHNAHTGGSGPLVGGADSVLTMQMQLRAVARVKLMMRSLRQQKKSEQFIAEALVDAVMSIIK